MPQTPNAYDLSAMAKKLDPHTADKAFAAQNLIPLEPYVNKNQKRRCKCLTCGRESLVRYAHVRDGGKCAYCSGKKVDLEVVDELFQENDLVPLEPYTKNTKPRKCRCTRCGNEVSPSYSSLQKGNGGCAICAGRRVDLTEVEKGFSINGLLPLEPYVGSDTPRLCVCVFCKNQVSPSWSSVKAGKSCGYCAGIRVSESDVESAFFGASLTPLEPYTTAKSKRKCTCNVCGNITFVRYANLKSGQGGCSTCASYGFDRSAPALVYLMHHEEFSSLKIGVTSTSSRYNRVNTHIKFGWTLIMAWEAPSGRQAEDLEGQVLNFWRKELSQPIHLEPTHTPQNGWTETVQYSDDLKDSTLFLIDSLIRDLKPYQPIADI